MGNLFTCNKLLHRSITTCSNTFTMRNVPMSNNIFLLKNKRKKENRNRNKSIHSKAVKIFFVHHCFECVWTTRTVRVALIFRECRESEENSVDWNRMSGMAPLPEFRAWCFAKPDGWLPKDETTRFCFVLFVFFGKAPALRDHLLLEAVKRCEKTNQKNLM